MLMLRMAVLLAGLPLCGQVLAQQPQYAPPPAPPALGTPSISALERAYRACLDEKVRVYKWSECPPPPWRGICHRQRLHTGWQPGYESCEQTVKEWGAR